MGFTEKLRKKDMALLTDVLPHITQYIKSLAQDGRFLNYSHYMHEEAAFDKEYEQWCSKNLSSAEASAKEDLPPEDGEAASPTPEPLPPTPPPGGATPNDVIPFDRHSFSDGGSNDSHPEGDVQSPSPSERAGVRPNVTSNGTSATPENNPKTATDLTPAQNDNTELSTKDIATQCDTPAPKPARRKVTMRSVEYKFTPNDRIF
jgi:hypothetical protein